MEGNITGNIESSIDRRFETNVSKQISRDNQIAPCWELSSKILKEVSKDIYRTIERIIEKAVVMENITNVPKNTIGRDIKKRIVRCIEGSRKRIAREP